MRSWSDLSVGCAHRLRALITITLFALSLCPAITHAQDVMVMPKAGSASEPASDSAPTINVFDVTTGAGLAATNIESPVAGSDAPEQRVQLARIEAAFQLQKTAAFSLLRCTTGADCTLIEGACGVVLAVSKNFQQSLPALFNAPCTDTRLLKIKRTQPLRTKDRLIPDCQEGVCNLQKITAAPPVAQ